MEESIYQPLQEKRKEIRIMTLIPCVKVSDPITCTMEVISLQDSPQFEGLSWVWGDAKDTRVIYVNSRERNVPANLWAALTQLRHPEQPRKIWVDAVCINQEDHCERESQVAMMGDIYRAATRTTVWLGQMTSHHDLEVFHILERLTQGVKLRQLCLEHCRLWEETDPLEPQFYELAANAREGSCEELLSKLSSFFEIDWWERLWVLQEVAVASTVDLFWGDKSIELAQFRRALDLVRNELRENLTAFKSLFGSYRLESFFYILGKSLGLTEGIRILYQEIRCTKEKDMSVEELCIKLIEVLAASRSRHSIDVRDKIYGLLGLFPRNIVQIISPSYLLWSGKVFRETAYKLMELTKSFILFNCIRDGEDSPPSWAPDWEYPFYQRQDFRLRTEQRQLFRACGTSSWWLKRPSENVLQVKGFRLDIVARKSNPQFEFIDAADLYHGLRDHSKILCRMSQDPSRGSQNAKDASDPWQAKYPTNIYVSETICRLALNDCAPASKSAGLGFLSDMNYFKFADRFRDVDEDRMGTYDAEVMKDSEALHFDGEEVPKSICTFARSVNRGKAFFATTLGYAALGDYVNVRSNDEIWILAGGSHPVVLQPVSGMDRSYHVCSEAYVQGVMQVEATRGECPVLPLDGDPIQVREDIQNGRTSWSVPEFIDIYLR